MRLGFRVLGLGCKVVPGIGALAGKARGQGPAAENSRSELTASGFRV